ncbi:MAG: ISNCY family transposase [Bacteroidales bacterium]|nr:ISNCY family transposase [Bacteroidales bacterium]
MELFSELTLKFEKPDWTRNPEFGLMDTILEQHPDLLDIVKEDITKGAKQSKFGRGDVPSVEQIMRAAIYQELKGLDYRDLEYHQTDSRICALFIKIDELRPYSFQMYQKYISRISEESLQKLLIELNKIAINEGLEDLKRIRQDSTVIETNIHHPTNNSLVWDCIKTSHRLLEKLSEELPETKYYNYIKSAKRTYFKINNTKSKDKQKQLFKKQLIAFTKTINNLSNAVKKKSNCNIKAYALISEIESFIPMCRKVYSQTERFQIHGEKVPNSEKIFSIYESHTDIIIKGAREVEFGHKIDLTGGKSNLILDCDILKGNVSDSKLYKPSIERIEKNYGKTPESTSNDGGYASKANSEFAQEKGIKNIVFNKIVGSLKNIASSKNMATRLKKWRSGIEAVISNLKRGFNLRRVNWKGFEHFKSKVLWSVIAYNIRVMTRLVIADLK